MGFCPASYHRLQSDECVGKAGPPQNIVVSGLWSAARWSAIWDHIMLYIIILITYHYYRFVVRVVWFVVCGLVL